MGPGEVTEALSLAPAVCGRSEKFRVTEKPRGSVCLPTTSVDRQADGAGGAGEEGGVGPERHHQAGPGWERSKHPQVTRGNWLKNLPEEQIGAVRSFPWLKETREGSL